MDMSTVRVRRGGIVRVEVRLVIGTVLIRRFRFSEPVSFTLLALIKETSFCLFEKRSLMPGSIFPLDLGCSILSRAKTPLSRASLAGLTLGSSEALNNGII